MTGAGTSAQFDAVLAECALHAQVLSSALLDWPAEWPGAVTALPIEPALRRTLDQVAYRFMKLQDTVGERLLPGVLALAEEPMRPDSTFAEKLQRLERLGALASVATWRLLREVRNSPAHEYPDNPALQAAAYVRLRRAAVDLIDLWQGVGHYVARHLSHRR